MRHFYYLHTNGEIIGKSALVVDADPQYFDSSFVRRVWETDSTDRGDAWIVVLEGLALGCNIEKARELSERWKLTEEDMHEVLSRVPVNEERTLGLMIFIEKILRKDPALVMNELAKKGPPIDPTRN